jgi:hypothetical protein
MKSQQSGFAHAFLIIGLLVALIGALGFVFWQNFIYVEPNRTEVVRAEPKSKYDSSSDKYSGWETYEDGEVKFSFRYPSDWSILKTDDKRVTLISPKAASADSNKINTADEDISLIVENKSGPSNNSGSWSILAFKAYQDGKDTSSYFTKKYSRTINSVEVSEFDIVANPSYFAAVFASTHNYIAVDFLSTAEKSKLNETSVKILESFKFD